MGRARFLGVVVIIAAGLLAACGGGSEAKKSSADLSACGGGVNTATTASNCGDTADTPEPAAQATGAKLTAASFDGIPQDGLTLGASSAPVTLDLYQNFLCPHCRDFALEALPALLTDYVQPGDLRIVFHDVAFGGTAAETAHDAARCAADQGKFWPAYLLLYENFSEDEADYTKDNLERVLAGAGIDATQLTACLAADQHLVEVNASTDAFTHLADSDAALASAEATAQAAQRPGIPLLTLAGRSLVAPETYAEVQAWLKSAIGR